METPTAPPPPPPPPTPVPAARPPASRRARAAWKTSGSIAAVAVLFWGASQAVAQLAHEERTTTNEYDAAGLRALDVRIDDGSLTVVATDATVVRVTARISDGLRPTSESQAVDGERLVLRGGCAPFFSNFCDVSYTVELPAGMSVRARLGNDDIRLTGVDGDIDAHTSNGDVTMRGSGDGVVVAASDNGDVTATDLRAAEVDADSDNGDVSLSFVRATTSVEATSDNGDVTVVVPDDGTSYTVSTGSSNGSTAAPIRTDPDSSRRITVKSHNGDVLVTYGPA